MVSAPLFSILMPTHDGIDTITHAIQSVLDQNIGDFELFVVGDGCATGTEGVVAYFNDPRIKFFDYPKAPYFGYANRNAALRHASGQFIAFAADDDLLFTDHLQLLHEALKAGAALACTQALWVSTDGIAAPFLTNLAVSEDLDFFMNQGNTIPASCFAYRADCLPVRNVWPENVPSAADWRLWRRIIRENPQTPPVYCDQPSVLHFSAKRKQSRYSAVRELETYLEIADHVEWWPKALRVAVESGYTAQDAYVANMRTDPQLWTNAVRQATVELVSKIAWTDIQTIRPKLDKVESTLKEAQERVLQLQKELQRIRDDVAVSSTATDNERKTLHARITAQGLELQGAQDTISRLRSSTSWRMTAPLRWLSSVLQAGLRQK